jgi:hypothetical protein
MAECKPNYTYSLQDASIDSVSDTKNTNKPLKIDLSGRVSNNRGQVSIKFNKKQAIHINTPKISNNQYLKLVNIAF